jgi:hypothetical protein
MHAKESISSVPFDYRQVANRKRRILSGAYILSLFCFLVLLSCSEKNSSLFVQVSPKHSGVTFNNTIIETDSFNILNNEYIFNGGGVGVGDFNNDEKPDLFFTGNQVANALYLNEGNFHFKDISKEAGIGASEKWSTGVAVMDINSDGWSDVYVCAAMHKDSSLRKNMLFVNQGLNANGVPTFLEKAGQYGIDDPKNSMNATFFDYDKDGLLDLYVLNNEQVHTLPTNYRPKINDGSAVSNDRLYHNNGDGTFSDVTKEAGIRYEGFGLGLAVADFNVDGWPDLHVSNDYLTNDLLYINNGDGTFSNEIRQFIKHQSKFSMGSDVADYNNDGLLDIITLDMLGETNQRMKTTISENNYISYVLNERFDYEYQYMRNMLHLGNGLGIPASEIGQMAGISKTDWSWSPLFADVDNDGLRDLLITNGFPRDITDMDFANYKLKISRYLGPEKILDSIPVVKIPNYAYRNQGDLTFEDASTEWGLDIPSFSNGAALADLDGDGDIDYVVNNINDPAFIFENKSDEVLEENRYLRVDLEGQKNNPDGIGAKLAVRYGNGEFQFYEHYLTRGYMSSLEKTIHFGLGSHKKIDTIEVLWPDGKFQQLTEIETDQTLTLEHAEAKQVDPLALNFPFVPKNRNPLFKEVSKTLGVDYTHKEKDVVDYNVQRILPHKLTQNGPCLAIGDINGDSFEDFIVGSSATYSPMAFLQNSDGTFAKKPLFDGKQDRAFEEEGMALFDLENDGDLDLYLVSGSNEFEEGSGLYDDRLLLNDGKGNFSVSHNRMPKVSGSGSVVKTNDFDNDGYSDIFVGGRTPVGRYPVADRSFLLKNEGGILKDVTDNVAPKLKNIGMVTDAVWADYDGDGEDDLIVVGELMPITVFKNKGASFEKLEKTGIENYLGWWESIVTEDIDGDGDPDFVVGNMGTNNFVNPSKDRPVTVIAKDFDANNSLDPITFAYFKNKQGEYDSYPVSFWGEINSQSRLFRSKFNLYKEYAEATEKTLLSDSEIKNALVLKGNFDQSAYVENLGNGTFKVHALPLEAQMAPLNDMLLTDVDGDGFVDLLGVGNDYGNETFTGRYDAFNGIVLKGNGNGSFKAIGSDESGFIVPGDAKAMAELKSVPGGAVYIVTQNREPLLMFEKSGNTPRPGRK